MDISKERIIKAIIDDITNDCSLHSPFETAEISDKKLDFERLFSPEKSSYYGDIPKEQLKDLINDFDMMLAELQYMHNVNAFKVGFNAALKLLSN